MSGWPGNVSKTQVSTFDFVNTKAWLISVIARGRKIKSFRQSISAITAKIER